MSFKRNLAAAAVVLSVVGAGLIAASPASAATGNCPRGATCVWKDTNYQTAGSDSALIGFQNYVDNYSFYSYGGYNANDSISSIYNNGNVSSVIMYMNANFFGPSFLLARKLGDGDLGNGAGAVPIGGWGDQISSGRFNI
jgi:hypothetical protein